MNVCGTHGGRAPQVVKSARQRLQEAAEPAAARLALAVESADEQIAVKAAQIILDRTGYHPSHSIELFGKDGAPIQTENRDVFEFGQLSVDLRRKINEELEALQAADGNGMNSGGNVSNLCQNGSYRPDQLNRIRELAGVPEHSISDADETDETAGDDIEL